MTWWTWTLLWLVVVAGAGVYLFVLGRGLWRTASALFTELGAATELLATLSDQLQELNTAVRPAEPELAVFADPQALRRARDREIRRRVRTGRASARRGEPARRRTG